jgi:hypothetical protein
MLSDYLKRWEEKPLRMRSLYHCHQASIKVCFSVKKPKGRELVFSKQFDYSALALVTTTVRIEVFPAHVNREKFALTIPAAEAAKLLAPPFPSEESLYRVMCEVYERKNFPIPDPGIPGGGGKSMTAQGQTKKPDAHSHKKHH